MKTHTLGYTVCGLSLPIHVKPTKLTSTQIETLPAAVNQQLKVSESLDRLAFSHLKSSKKYETPSEYSLGGGLVLTTSQRPRGLPDFPFGIRYQAATAESDLKCNLLCTSLDAFEISRLSALGMNSPKYYQMGNDFSVFMMTSKMNSTGFYTSCGTLIFTDRYHRTIIPTFDTVMLLIAATPAVPSLIRKRAMQAMVGGTFGTVFRHRHAADKYALTTLLEGNTAGESSSKTTNDNYQPQSGELSSPCLDAVQTCSEGIKLGLDLKLNEFMTNNTALMPDDLTTQSMQALIKIFTLENKFYSLMGVFVMYMAYRVLRDLVLTIHFAAGLLTGIMYTNKQKLLYTPQSGFISAGTVTNIAKLLTTTGQMLAGSVMFFVTLAKMREQEQLEYSPQASSTFNSDSGDDFKGTTPKSNPKKNKGAPPSASPGITVRDQGQASFGGTTAVLKAIPKPKKQEPPFFGGFGTGI